MVALVVDMALRARLLREIVAYLDVQEADLAASGAHSARSAGLWRSIRTVELIETMLVVVVAVLMVVWTGLRHRVACIEVGGSVDVPRSWGWAMLLPGCWLTMPARFLSAMWPAPHSSSAGRPSRARLHACTAALSAALAYRDARLVIDLVAPTGLLRTTGALMMVAPAQVLWLLADGTGLGYLRALRGSR